MIFIYRIQEPKELANKGKTEQLALCNEYDKGKRHFPTTDFKSSIYAHEKVKEALITMQYDKCCFCESKVTHIGYGDVEHYRPKGGYKQNESEPLQPLGYYWLAYTWDNLLFSCQLCNQQYKKNLFPLLNPENRARNHHDDTALEKPLLINPSIINPQEHIAFREEIPYAINNSLYGKTTISALGLDREALNEVRRTKFKLFAHLFDVLKLADEQPDNVKLQEQAEKIKPLLEQAVLPTAEYSAMISAYKNIEV